LQVSAEDGGTPRRSGSVVVDVVITDVNDNSPRFERAVYDVEITEHAPPQRNVIVVRSGTQGCNWAMIRPMSCHKIAGWGGEKG